MAERKFWELRVKVEAGIVFHKNGVFTKKEFLNELIVDWFGTRDMEWARVHELLKVQKSESFKEANQLFMMSYIINTLK